MDVIIDTITSDPLVIIIPFIAGVVGWFTNVVAVKMMFYPLSFVGIPPIFGWQGVVPANARELASKSTDIITTKLINLRMVFEQFDAEGFSGNLDTALDELTDEIIAETAEKYAPDQWKQMPDPVKAQIRTMLRSEIKAVSVKILADMGDCIEDLIDLKEIVIESVHRDRALIGEMFQTTGSEEFKFIKISGLYFGFLFGVVQLFVWLVYPAWWVLPFFGFFVGYVTNWLAIKLIFQPAEPMKIGPLTIQGLFHKRQKEVAREFANMVSRDILNTDNMVEQMSTGKAGAKLYSIVEEHIGELLEKYQKNPMTAALAPGADWDEIRSEINARIREELPKPGGFLYIFVGRAIDVYGELLDRMTALDSKSFEGVLRPAFQKDEWKLIVAGGALGFGAGVLQVVYLFGDQVT